MKNYLKIIGFVVVCEIAGLIGTIFTTSEIPTWFATLNKPFLSPPNWVFGPVWTILYALMGISVGIIWNIGIKNKESKRAFMLFIIQLLLNVLWSIIFFGNHNLFVALIDIVIMWALILATIFAFYKISRPAAYLLIPYLLWVSFATYLNFSFWLIN